MLPEMLVNARVREIALNREEAKLARALAGNCADEYVAADSPEFLAEVNVIAQELPLAPRRAVNRARLDEAKHAVLITGNMLRDDLLNDTPAHWRDPQSEEARLSGFTLMLWAALLGDPIGWTTQQDGRILTDVLPVAGHEQTDVSSSSRKELTWHTEDAFSPYRADYVGLYCLRNPDLTPTTLAAADPLALPGWARETLAQPRFLTRADDAHDQDTTRPETGAVLTGPAEAAVLRIDRDCTVAAPGDEDARAALELIFGQLDANLYDFALAPGDLIFLDNRNVVHGRRPFRARYDGRDRWLRRINVTADLRRTRAGRRSGDDRRIG
ncbi:guanitoxin biosynthesis L-enduracididine beta-hydroxylase GntD [Nonomuraea sp. KM90]|uniref:guanitoxin biosynthesis L-enduracididine beta-hydroxylase GntD n=1 Tax=Nonomuraea sp. KM90 TaxID=3457428 RepID=UPI003FCE6C97